MSKNGISETLIMFNVANLNNIFQRTYSKMKNQVFNSSLIMVSKYSA
jgi:hypothetical protein